MMQPTLFHLLTGHIPAGWFLVDSLQSKPIRICFRNSCSRSPLPLQFLLLQPSASAVPVTAFVAAYFTALHAAVTAYFIQFLQLFLFYACEEDAVKMIDFMKYIICSNNCWFLHWHVTCDSAERWINLEYTYWRLFYLSHCSIHCLVFVTSLIIYCYWKKMI